VNQPFIQAARPRIRTQIQSISIPWEIITMVYVNVRHTCTDYKTWRSFFDGDESHRKANGATGNKHVFRDVNDPNVITVILEWDSAENANKFLNDPRLREVMAKAGVVGAPALIALLNAA
jgi:hypothetical protein